MPAAAPSSASQRESIGGGGSSAGSSVSFQPGLVSPTPSSARRSGTAEKEPRGSFDGRSTAVDAREERRAKRSKAPLSIASFEILKPISRGAYGHVVLAAKKTTRDLFAIKVLRKGDMRRKNQVERIKAERDVLASVAFLQVLPKYCKSRIGNYCGGRLIIGCWRECMCFMMPL